MYINEECKTSNGIAVVKTKMAKSKILNKLNNKITTESYTLQTLNNKITTTKHVPSNTT